MRFLDLKTGHTFDALWTDGQTNGYTFWFPKEQSVNLTYVMPICMVTETDTPITIEVEDNEVFKFITSTTTEITSGFTFGLPEYHTSITTDVEQIGDGVYAHKFYVSASSELSGEYSLFLDVNGYGRIRIGADFYGENESLYINLSNFGVEIPESVQKTIFDSNVHEDYKDNILINRKFKELISNYWDIIANRGSYKSLQNSLKWFEWGDVLRIREMWKRNHADRVRFDDREIRSLLEDKYLDSMNDFNKTTYLSLFASTHKNGTDYDSEHNPVLEALATKWTKEELGLKLSLLAEFFGTFFLPIHLSIFHSCVEDKVFTNTIKALNGVMTCRYDVVGDFSHVECNITDGQTFRIDNVRAQVTKDTLFGITTDMDTRHTYFGVDIFPSDGMVDEESLPTFAQQYYTGPGVIIPIRFSLGVTDSKEFLKYVSVAFNPDGDTENDLIIFRNQFYQRGGKINLKFNLLSKIAREYDMVFTFILSSGKTLTRRLRFSTIDVDNLNLSLYRIVARDNRNEFTYDDFYSTDMNNYLFKLQNTAPMVYKQYLPYMENPTEDYKGVKLTRTVVIDVKGVNHEIPRLNARMSGFLSFKKTAEDGTISYLIFVSKKFNKELPSGVIGNYKVIRNDLGFYPQFHTIERIEGNTIEDYTISQYDALCVIPEIHKYDNVYEPFRYGHLISNPEWEFVNNSTNGVVTHPASSAQPFVASNNNTIMEDGFYDIVFRYRLSNEDRELRLDSAFRKKTV